MKAVPRRLLVLGGGAVGVEMAQAVRGLGGEAVVVEGGARVLAREAAPLGEALGVAMRRDGVEIVVGARVRGRDAKGRTRPDPRRRPRGARRPAPRGDGSSPARRRPRPGERGHQGRRPWDPVDARLGAGERVWAIGDANGIVLLTHVGKYQADVVAANILGQPREAHYEAVPRVVFTEPQAAAVGATEAPFRGTARLKEVAKTATYSRAYAEDNGFLTLLSDGDRLTGAYALGDKAGEWLQQATLAIRARVPLDVLRDVIQPFPTFSEIYAEALKALATRSPGHVESGRSES